MSQYRARKVLKANIGDLKGDRCFSVLAHILLKSAFKSNITKNISKYPFSDVTNHLCGRKEQRVLNSGIGWSF